VYAAAKALAKRSSSDSGFAADAAAGAGAGAAAAGAASGAAAAASASAVCGLLLLLLPTVHLLRRHFSTLGIVTQEVCGKIALGVLTARREKTEAISAKSCQMRAQQLKATV
jgi:hypothetical protein